MAAAQKITRFNYTGLLVRSTQGREGTPDGNIFPDPANDRIQIITREELPLVNLGSGLEDNPLTNEDKIQLLAVYYWLKTEIANDTTLQNFRRSMEAAPNKLGRLVGATSTLSGIKLASGAVNANGIGGSLGDDRLKICDSGLTEFAPGGGGGVNKDRVYHGVKSLNEINATSQPFYQIAASLSEADRQAAAPVDFSKTGSINELIQTFGSTANGDTGAGDFDNQSSVLIIGVRDYGQSVGETNSSAAGVAELGAYSQGYGIGNKPVPEVAAISQTDVWGGAQVSPFTGLAFTRLATPEAVGGFVEGTGNFTDKITNSAGANLIQIRAWLDMLMQQDTDQNVNTATTGAFLPKRAEPLYTIDEATGSLVTRQGLIIEGVPASDQQKIIQKDDAGNTFTYPVVTPVVIKLSSAWQADADAYFRLMFEDGAGAADFDTPGAVVVEDASSTPVSGGAADGRIVPVTGGYELRFSFAYDTNTQAGLSAGVDKNVVLKVGGGVTVQDRDFTFTIGETAVTFDASVEAEDN